MYFNSCPPVAVLNKARDSRFDYSSFLCVLIFIDFEYKGSPLGILSEGHDTPLDALSISTPSTPQANHLLPTKWRVFFPFFFSPHFNCMSPLFLCTAQSLPLNWTGSMAKEPQVNGKPLGIWLGKLKASKNGPWEIQCTIANRDMTSRVNIMLIAQSG